MSERYPIRSASGSVLAETLDGGSRDDADEARAALEAARKARGEDVVSPRPSASG